MNLIILASVLIFAFVLSIGIKRSNKEIEQAKEDFWEKERKANFVRKKSLDNLNYISIPEDFLNYPYDLTNSRVNDAVEMIKHLSDCKIVNFSGITNTDLKLEYGTANIGTLSEYDYNYTGLARSLQTLAESLQESGNKNEAIKILEFLISTGTDMSSTYKLLGNIYKEQNQLDKIDSLIESANNMQGLMKTAILEYLNELK